MWAGGNAESYKKATQVAKKCLDLEISERELRNLTENFGRERAVLRDAEVSRFLQRKLPPRHVEPPSVGVFSIDGGRAQIRASESPPGVHEPAWTEVKVANLSTYTDVRFPADPQPEPPARYLDPPQVIQLVDGLKGATGKRSNRKAKSPTEAKVPQSRPPRVPGPERKVRTVVATAQKTEAFGMMVATEAAGRGFYQAKKKAALGDGGAWIWALVALHFVGFVPILDFVHLLAYLYEAAVAAYRADAKCDPLENQRSLARSTRVESGETRLSRGSAQVGPVVGSPRWGVRGATPAGAREVSPPWAAERRPGSRGYVPAHQAKPGLNRPSWSRMSTKRVEEV